MSRADYDGRFPEPPYPTEDDMSRAKCTCRPCPDYADPMFWREDEERDCPFHNPAAIAEGVKPEKVLLTMPDCVRNPENLKDEQEETERLRHDIEAYRGALGYDIPGNHDGHLSDGTVPHNGIAEALSTQLSAIAEGVRAQDYEDAELCSVCKTPVRYGTRHSSCGWAVMELEKEIDRLRARVAEQEAKVESKAPSGPNPHSSYCGQCQGCQDEIRALSARVAELEGKK